MKRLKKLTFVAAVLLAGSSLGFGQLSFNFSTVALYRQGPSSTTFRKPGTYAVALVDGSATITACGLNGSLTWFGPYIPAGCPKGATAYIAGGDLNSDGIRDDFTYWEITGVTPAVAIEPDSPELCSVYSRPASSPDFPMDLGFYDGTETIYFNVQSEAIKEYKITKYSNGRDYFTRDEMDKAVSPGIYEFLFPMRNNKDQAVKIPVIHRNIPEGYRKQNHVGQGFRFTKLNGSALIWSADGYVEMDPRVINTFEWQGSGIEVMIPTTDITYFAILDLGPPLPGDPERDAPAALPTLFPGFVAPGTSRVLLANAITSKFILPPGFIPVTSPAKEGVAEFTLIRNAPTSTVASDSSQRRFQMPVRFVNTYEGWAAVSFPPGTPSSLREKGADPDGDGYSNYLEWLAGTNPMLASSHPAAPKLTFVQGRAARSISSAAAGRWETKVTKADVWPALAYQYEFSTDMQNWRTIGNDDPDWLLTETSADPVNQTSGEIKVQSKKEKLSGSGFLRVKMTELPDTSVPDQIDQ